jgi:Protein of unknown function (DUF3313)
VTGRRSFQWLYALRKFRLPVGVSVCLMVAGAPILDAAEPPPQVSKDGLQLEKQTKQRLVYLKPGATFSQYKRVAILECAVEFRKNWARDYNSEHAALENQVSDSDIQRMKSALSSEFKKVFVKELTNGGYQVVDTAAPDVLVLRPALVNVDPTAPDLMTANMEITVVRSAGQMTLYLELWDSATNTILARVMDAKADQQGFAQPANRVTNTAAADAILKSWADELRDHLEAVRGKPNT